MNEKGFEGGLSEKDMEFKAPADNRDIYQERREIIGQFPISFAI